MFATLRSLVTDLLDPRSEHSYEESDYRLAAAALLVRAAMIDGHFDESERTRLHQRLKLRFDLDDEGARKLIDQATVAEREAVDLYRFTSLLNRSLDDEGRRHMVELMWEIVYADKRVSEFEDNLLWRVADLLHVPARDRIELRRRVAGQAGQDGE